MKKKPTSIFILTIILLVIITVIISLLIVLKSKENINVVDKNISSTFVKVLVDTPIFTKEEDSFKEVGIYFKDNELEVQEDLIKTYIKIKNSSYYLKKDSLQEIKELTPVIINDRYNYYVPFDQVIIAKNPTIYNEFDKPIYKINEDIRKPIIIKDEGSYGIEINDNLYYIKEEDVLEIEYEKTTDKEKASSVRALLYHFFYNDTEWRKWSNNIIAMHTDTLEEQFIYLKENNYLTLKMDEVKMFVEGKINIPKNSVLLTADDGNYSVIELAFPLMEKYNMNWAIFGVTEWDPEIITWKTDYAEIHSHTNDMHQGGCPGGQGGLIKCIDHEDGVKDLTLSSERLNGSKYLAYPFGEYNDHAIKIVKASGYEMALTTNTGKIKPGDDLLKLNRTYIYNNVTLNQFISLIK